MSRHAGHLQAGAGRLKEAWDELSRRWLVARDHWQDENARRFEDQELRHIAEELQRVLPAISQMAQVIAHAERDLSEEE